MFTRCCESWAKFCKGDLSAAQHSTAQHSPAQHSTAQHSTAQHSTAQHALQQLACEEGMVCGDQQWGLIHASWGETGPPIPAKVCWRFPQKVVMRRHMWQLNQSQEAVSDDIWANIIVFQRRGTYDECTSHLHGEALHLRDRGKGCGTRSVHLAPMSV